jgi:hypothetical protein
MGTLLDARNAANEVLYEAEKRVRELRSDIEQAERNVTTARRNGYATLIKQEANLDYLREKMTQAEAEAKVAKEEAKQSDMALYQVRLGRRALRLADVFAMLGHDVTDLTIRADWSDEGRFWRSSTWELSLAALDENGAQITKQSKDYHGREFEYVETRFGFGATVYGPRVEYGDEIKGAEVNWGTLGSLSPADAREMLRVHTYAIQVAEYLDSKRDAWQAEDDAD